MKVLLHVCCAPCTIYPYTVLKGRSCEITAFFYNPNIHPFREFKERLNTFQQYATTLGLAVLMEKEYGLVDFVRKVAFHESERCQICYFLRLEKTASLAKDSGFDAFTTTLLYSKYQRHSTLISICNNLSAQYDIPFFYHDFREGWQAGVDASLEMKMYRQSYCGCLYSEHERYDKKAFRNRR